MSKNSRGQKEFTRLQEFINENKKLKREISSLRKQLARLDLDRHSYVRGIVEEHLAIEEHETSTKDMLTSMKNEWQCRQCGTGFLEINLYTRHDGTFYFRHCNNCIHRTRAKRYTPDVKGIIKPDPDSSK